MTPPFLPNELLCTIAQFLSKKDLLAFIRVNKAFQAVGARILYNEIEWYYVQDWREIPVQLLLRTILEPTSSHLVTLIKEIKVGFSVFGETIRCCCPDFDWNLDDLPTAKCTGGLTANNVTQLEELVHSLSTQEGSHFLSTSEWIDAIEGRRADALLALLLLHNRCLTSIAIAYSPSFDSCFINDLFQRVLSAPFSADSTSAQPHWPNLMGFGYWPIQRLVSADQLSRLASMPRIRDIRAACTLEDSVQCMATRMSSLEKLCLMSYGGYPRTLYDLLQCSPSLHSLYCEIWPTPLKNLREMGSVELSFDGFGQAVRLLEESLEVLFISFEITESLGEDNDAVNNDKARSLVGKINCSGSIGDLSGFKKLTQLDMPVNAWLDRHWNPSAERDASLPPVLEQLTLWHDSIEDVNYRPDPNQVLARLDEILEQREMYTPFLKRLKVLTTDPWTDEELARFESMRENSDIACSLELLGEGDWVN